jgi:DNA invertase Pin-like site-specific DNA recombinase
MRAIGYARVSTDKQADAGVSLEVQTQKIQAMAVVHGSELVDVIVDGGESAKNLNRPGMERLLAVVDRREVQTVIVAKLDRLTRSVKDLGHLLERFEKRGVALISVAESLDTGSAAGRLVITIMTAGVWRILDVRLDRAPSMGIQAPDREALCRGLDHHRNLRAHSH